MCSSHGRCTHCEGQMKELVRSGSSAYDILGVSRDTTPTDVEKAYRRKCLKWHPDKWQTHSPEEQKKAEDTFKEIGLCRDILRSTVTRAIYDDMVRNFSDSSSDEGPWVRTTTFRGTPFSGKGPQSAWTSPPSKPKPSISSSSSSRVPPPRQPAGPPPAGSGAYGSGAYGQAPPFGGDGPLPPKPTPRKGRPCVLPLPEDSLQRRHWC